MKIYLSGSDPSIRVPLREIALSNGERVRLSVDAKKIKGRIGK